jgi:hypothetical protein
VLVASTDNIIRSKPAADRAKDRDVLPQMRLDFQQARERQNRGREL